jgi:hypothetical protein
LKYFAANHPINIAQLAIINASFPDQNAVEDGDFTADPAVGSDVNATPRDTLLINGRGGVGVLVVFGMATEILSNDADLVDPQATATAQVIKFANSDVVAQPNTHARLDE